MKTCTKCKIEKPFEDFAKREKSVDGYRGQCRKCVRARQLELNPLVEIKHRDCTQCGTSFKPEDNRIKLCSESCKAESRKLSFKRYASTDKCKAYRKEYSKTEKAIAAREAYESRPEVKKSKREAGRKFDKSQKGRWKAFCTKIKSHGGFIDDTFENYIKHCDKTNCDVCRVELTSDRKGGNMRCVDHCHTTGKIRGALCMKCNSAEGYLKSDVEIIRSLLEYLERTNGN